MRCYQDDCNMNDNVKVVCKKIDVVYRLNDVVYKDISLLRLFALFTKWKGVCKMIDVADMFYKDIYSANDVYKVKRLLRLFDVIYHLQKSCLKDS